jgi:small subunit ribosomal protein S10
MKYRLILKAYNAHILNLAYTQLINIIINSDARILSSSSLPLKIKRFCVLRSPHVDKNSREHFEIRISKKITDIEFITPESFNSLLNLELPSGVACNLKQL